MKLIFANWQKGRGLKAFKRFEEPIDFSQLCRKLEPDHSDEALLQDWILVETEGNSTVNEAFFGGRIGWALPELQGDLDFACGAFEEWENERTLELIIKAADERQVSFDVFLWEGWRCVLGKEDIVGLSQAFSELDPVWAWRYHDQEPTLEEIETFARQNASKVVEVEDVFVILT